MDMRTGKWYDTREAALAAGVPESDIADVFPNGAAGVPEVKFSTDIERLTEEAAKLRDLVRVNVKAGR